jgi:hypothetical protein
MSSESLPISVLLAHSDPVIAAGRFRTGYNHRTVAEPRSAADLPA